MPIYEYMCNDCKRPFEELVLSVTAPVACPICDGRRIERLMSVVHSRSGADSAPMPATACGRQLPGCDGHGGCGCH